MRATRGVVAVAAIVTAVWAAPGQAAPAARPTAVHVPGTDQVSDAPPRVTPQDLSSHERTRQLARTFAARRLAQRAAAPGSTIVIVIGFGPSGDGVVPIADLDHDGAQEVLQSRTTTGRPSVVVLSGRTGRTLWSHADPGLVGAEYVPASSGPGTVIAYAVHDEQDVDAFAAFGWQDTFSVQGLQARTGAAVWSQDVAEAVTSTPAGDVWNGAEADGLLHRRGAAPLLLLDSTTCGWLPATSGCHVQPLLVDVATGDVTGTGIPATSDGFAWIQPLGDLDADGTDDVASVAFGTASSVTVWSGATAQPLWQRLFTTDGFGGLAPSPDLSGDGHDDVLLSTYGDHGVVTALRGTDASTVWSRPGDYGVPVGDVDHDRRSDTRVVTFGDNLLHYELVTARGTTWWQRTVRYPAARGIIALSYPAGDVDHDGATDIYVRFVDKAGLFDLAAPGHGSVLVNSRTGVMRALPDLGVPLGGSVDGRGDDFYGASAAHDALTTTAYDGATGRALWHRSVPGSQLTDVWSGRFGTGRPGVVAAVVRPQRETVLVQDGASGRTTWSTSYALPAPIAVPLPLK